MSKTIDRQAPLNPDSFGRQCVFACANPRGEVQPVAVEDPAVGCGVLIAGVAEPHARLILQRRDTLKPVRVDCSPPERPKVSVDIDVPTDRHALKRGWSRGAAISLGTETGARITALHRGEPPCGHLFIEFTSEPLVSLAIGVGDLCFSNHA